MGSQSCFWTHRGLERATDIVEDKHLDVVVCQHGIEREAVLVAGQRQVPARALVDEFTGKKVDVRQQRIPGQLPQALLELGHGHFAVHIEDGSCAVHGPFEKGRGIVRQRASSRSQYVLPTPVGRRP